MLIGIFVGCSENSSQSYKDGYRIYQQLKEKRGFIEDNSKGNWQMTNKEVKEIENIMINYTKEDLKDKEKQVLSSLTEAMNYYLKTMVAYEVGDGLGMMKNIGELDSILIQLDQYFKK